MNSKRRILCPFIVEIDQIGFKRCFRIFRRRFQVCIATGYRKLTCWKHSKHIVIG